MILRAIVFRDRDVVMGDDWDVVHRDLRFFERTKANGNSLDTRTAREDERSSGEGMSEPETYLKGVNFGPQCPVRAPAAETEWVIENEPKSG